MLDTQVPQAKPKIPAHSDGIFGVCATIPLNVFRKEGHGMQLLHYHGKVISAAMNARALANEIKRVRKLELKNAKAMEGPDQNLRPGVWLNNYEAENPYEVSFSDAFANLFAHLFCFSKICSLASVRTGRTIWN